MKTTGLKAIIERAMEFYLVEDGVCIPDFYGFTYDPENHYLFWYKEKRGFFIDDDRYVVIDKATGEVNFL